VCAGPWIPTPLPGAVSDLCSACSNGTLLMTRSVAPVIQCANIPSVNFTSCSFPCLGNSPSPNVSSVPAVLTQNNYLQNLLMTLDVC
jgi:hypothetical protein